MLSCPEKLKITPEPASAIRAALVLFSLCIWCTVSSSAFSAESKKTEDAKPGNCMVCHEGRKVLPAGHVKTDGMRFAECNRCHQKSGDKNKPDDLRGRLSLGHAHQFGGIPCSGCHGEARPLADVDGQKCLNCHADYKSSSKPTDKSIPGPHQSHMGDLDCLLCHHVHTRSENFCGQCHWWKYKVP
jgi:hypothetical protein